MTDRRARGRAAVAASALVLTLAGCSGSGVGTSPPTESPADPPARSPAGSSLASSAAPTSTPAPTPTAAEAPRPKVGACHRLDFDAAVAPTAGLDAVSCSKAHTAETYDVGTVASLADGHLLAVDSDQVQQQVATSCPAALPEALGGTLEDVRLSMLRAVWFTPTVEESDAGADWYRCDVVALAGAEQLTRTRGSLEGVLNDAGRRDTYAMCGTAGPDEADFERVPCSAVHSWRAFSVIDLPPGTYPGRSAVADAGAAPCKDAAAGVAADPLDYAWAYEGPDPDQWAAGQTFIRCWTPD